MDRPTCKTCPFYDAEAKIEVSDITSYTAACYPKTKTLVGMCKFIPISQHKTPDDWCGKHPSFPAYIASLKPPKLNTNLSPNDHLCAWLKSKSEEELDQILKILSLREREVIKLHFGLHPCGSTYTVDEIARIFKVTQARAMQIKAKAIKLLLAKVQDAITTQAF